MLTPYVSPYVDEARAAKAAPSSGLRERRAATRVEELPCLEDDVERPAREVEPRKARRFDAYDPSDIFQKIR